MDKETNYIGYEYLDVTLTHDLYALFIDGYKSFGWVLLDKHSRKMSKKTTLYFKRNRKIRNKAELTRLQRQFDSLIMDIQSIEKKKNFSPKIISYLVFIIGCTFMALSVFSITSKNMPVTIVGGILGFTSWVSIYFVYTKMKVLKIQQTHPLIEADFDLIYEVCEKGNHLL